MNEEEKKKEKRVKKSLSKREGKDREESSLCGKFSNLSIHKGPRVSGEKRRKTTGTSKGNEILKKKVKGKKALDQSREPD